jgi:serine/threonine-protein kinase
MSRAVRYHVVNKIAHGGMAEIFLAVQTGAEGFQKQVVLKRILPALAADPSFVRMLVDEAHIASTLNHSNVVQVLDLGKSGDQFFLVLEFVDGWSLEQVRRRAKKARMKIPLPLALYIVSALCRALAYAHGRKRNGQALGIVHRDVTPQNVLLSREGEVKLADFGIAKAIGKREKSVTGVIKGKFAYMSPEQSIGAELDERSDLFSVGTVLYVLTTGRKPFEGTNDLDVLMQVRKARYEKPSAIIKDFNPEVERFIARALRPDRDRRWQTAEQMADRLDAILLKLGQTSGPAVLKRWLDNLTAKDGAKPPAEAIGAGDTIQLGSQDLELEDVPPSAGVSGTPVPSARVSGTPGPAKGDTPLPATGDSPPALPPRGTPPPLPQIEVSGTASVSDTFREDTTNVTASPPSGPLPARPSPDVSGTSRSTSNGLEEPVADGAVLTAGVSGTTAGVSGTNAGVSGTNAGVSGTNAGVSGTRVRTLNLSASTVRLGALEAGDLGGGEESLGAWTLTSVTAAEPRTGTPTARLASSAPAYAAIEMSVLFAPPGPSPSPEPAAGPLPGPAPSAGAPPRLAPSPAHPPPPSADTQLVFGARGSAPARSAVAPPLNRPPRVRDSERLQTLLARPSPIMDVPPPDHARTTPGPARARTPRARSLRRPLVGGLLAAVVLGGAALVVAGAGKHPPPWLRDPVRLWLKRLPAAKPSEGLGDGTNWTGDPRVPDPR